MAVTVSATQADNAAGWTAVGDPHWVPDVGYYRRFVLSCTGSAGEVGSVVLWEIYDSKAVPFATNAATVTVQATGGTYTGATAPAYLNNRNTNTIWVRNAKAQDGGAPYYTETGQPWVSALRANGPRVTVELPVTFKWGAGVVDTATFEAAAYLPGGGRTPAGTASITVNNPKIADLKTVVVEEAPPEEPEPDPVPVAEDEKYQDVPVVTPDASWTVSDIQSWLSENGIAYPLRATKDELLKLVPRP